MKSHPGEEPPRHMARGRQKVEDMCLGILVD